MRLRDLSGKQLAVVVLLSLASGWPPALAALSSPEITAAECAVDIPPVDCFVVEPRIQEMVLSPRGDQLAYLLREEAGVSLWVWDLRSDRRQRRFVSRSVEALHWSSDGGGLFFEASERLAWMPVQGHRPIWIHRLESEKEQHYLMVDPVRPRHFLLTESAPGELHRLVRVDSDGEEEELLRLPHPAHSFLLDPSGQVAFYKGSEDLEQVVYRRVGDSWSEELRCDSIDSCQLLVADEKTLWVRGRLERDLWGLWAVDLDSGALRSVHEDPRGLADLRNVWVDPALRRPRWVDHHSDRLRNFALDPEMADHLAEIRRARQWGDLEVDPRPTGGFWLLREADSRLQHPKYFLYDSTGRTVRPVLESEHAEGLRLAPERLAAKEFFSYRGSDGMLLHGFVSMPSWVDPTRVPIVARIHGGPWNHVRPGYNGFTQFLVNRGYAVFEPNFRASTGYGYAYLEAGVGEFGDGRVQQDILDGLFHLQNRGIGDPDRRAMVGHSFGGFATLGAMAFVPEHFRVGIASAPPIDLVRSLQDLDERTLMANGISQKRAVLELLFDSEDPMAEQELRKKSPEANLDRTSRPLLLLAGGRDEKVAVSDVKHYALALRELGKDVSLLVDDAIGHSFVEKPMQEAYFFVVERFLAHHLGGEVSSWSGAGLEGYLSTRLRMTGPSLRQALRRDVAEGKEGIEQEAAVSE